MKRNKLAFWTTLLSILHYAQAAWAVKSDGSLGADFIAALVNAATQVWLPAILAIGLLVVVGLMVLGRGGQFIQKFGFWICAVIVVGGGFTYFSGFAGGPVSMTMTIANISH